MFNFVIYITYISCILYIIYRFFIEALMTGYVITLILILLKVVDILNFGFFSLFALIKIGNKLSIFHHMSSLHLLLDMLVSFYKLFLDSLFNCFRISQ